MEIWIIITTISRYYYFIRLYFLSFIRKYYCVSKKYITSFKSNVMLWFIIQYYQLLMILYEERNEWQIKKWVTKLSHCKSLISYFKTGSGGKKFFELRFSFWGLLYGTLFYYIFFQINNNVFRIFLSFFKLIIILFY